MQFEILYRELANSTEVIRSLLAGIAQEEAQIILPPKSWSILEVTCHLYDEEREDFREHLDLILHRPTGEWHSIDPEDWMSSRKYNEQNFAEMRDKFFSERRKSLDWLNDLAGAAWDTPYTSDYGSMPTGEMFSSWVAHDNLHIRQLVELRHHRIVRITQPYSVS